MPTNVGLSQVDKNGNLIGPKFWIHANSVSEGIKKDIGKIPRPVGTSKQPGASDTPVTEPEEANSDVHMFLDLLKITNDIAIAGWIMPNDISGKSIDEIRDTLKTWMRSGALVALDYRTNGNFDFGLRGVPKEAWIVEDIVFVDEDTEREAFISQCGSTNLPDDWIGLKITIKLVLGVLVQNRR
jgi:hypothetical protein